jgi:hypothetical protein
MGKKSCTENKYIIVSEIDNLGGLKVGMVQLNRLDVLNALNIPFFVKWLTHTKHLITMIILAV